MFLSQVWVWRVGGAGESKVLGGAGERVECGQVLGDGRRVVAGYSDGSAKVWDMKTGDQLHSLTGVHKVRQREQDKTTRQVFYVQEHSN